MKTDPTQAGPSEDSLWLLGARGDRQGTQEQKEVPF